MPNPRGERSGSYGLNKIFKMLDQGKSVSEITAKMDEKERAERESRERGRESEQNVITALKELEWVEKVRYTAENQSLDSKRRDVGVEINPSAFTKVHEEKLLIPERAVFIQVKSSDVGITHFRHHMMEVCQLPSDSALSDWLRHRRLMVINGQSGDEHIIGSFVDELLGINKYWMAR